MARNPSTSQRKRPRQERSRATVDAILEAAARVLEDAGYAAATTNRIARVAGVSVGSLYQYFPNKAAILRALLERHLAEALALRPAALDRPPSELPLRERIRIAVGWYLDVHARAPRLHQELTVHAPAVLGGEGVRRFERLLHATLREILAGYADALRPVDLEIAAFLVAQCMESLTHGAVVHHPELLGRPELAAEMTELIAGYLEGRSAADGAALEGRGGRDGAATVSR